MIGHTNAWTYGYKSQSARDAKAGGHRREYCDYLEAHALELCARFTLRDDYATAKDMLTQSLGASLIGNDGD